MSKNRPLKSLLLIQTAAVCLIALGTLVACVQPQGQDGDRRTAANKDMSLVAAGQQAYAAQDTKSAIAFYRSALSINPNNADALIGLGEAHLALGQWREASGSFREALVIDDADPTAQRGYAMALMGEGKADIAIPVITGAVEQERSAANLLILGAALDTLSRHEEAQAAYLEGIQLHPRRLSLRNNLALSYALSGDHRQAYSIMRNVVDAPDSDLRHDHNLILVSGLAGNQERAEADGRAAGMTRTQISEILAYANYILQAQEDGKADLGRILGVASVSPVREGGSLSGSSR